MLRCQLFQSNGLLDLDEFCFDEVIVRISVGVVLYFVSIAACSKLGRLTDFDQYTHCLLSSILRTEPPWTFWTPRDSASLFHMFGWYLQQPDANKLDKRHESLQAHRDPPQCVTGVADRAIYCPSCYVRSNVPKDIIHPPDYAPMLRMGELQSLSLRETL